MNAKYHCRYCGLDFDSIEEIRCHVCLTAFGRQSATSTECRSTACTTGTASSTNSSGENDEERKAHLQEVRAQVRTQGSSEVPPLQTTKALL